jgi:hypothetical protein
MTSSLEFSARAALCRQLARREPNSKILWLAEAERWSRLTVAPGVAAKTPVYRNAASGDAFQAFLGGIYREPGPSELKFY